MKELTLYERNFNIATNNLLKLGGKPIEIRDVINIFFDGIKKETVILKDYEPVEGRKNAIVLIGQSCTGKSTYAKKFVCEHPEFEYVSMDECAIREAETANVIHCYSYNILDNDLGNREFGKMLEKGKNIIIDGCWLHLNSRSALLKTLRQLNYVTCACIFQYSDELHQSMIVYRAMQNAAREILHGNFSIDEVDWLLKYQEKFNFSYKQAIEHIQRTSNFREELRRAVDSIVEEFKSSAMQNQMNSGVIFVSFDFAYKMNVNGE